MARIWQEPAWLLLRFRSVQHKRRITLRAARAYTDAESEATWIKVANKASLPLSHLISCVGVVSDQVHLNIATRQRNTTSHLPLQLKTCLSRGHVVL